MKQNIDPMIKKLMDDLDNWDIPKDLNSYNKIKVKQLIPGTKINWYYEEDKKFCEEEGLKPRDYNYFSGIIVPKPYIEYRGGEIEAEECVVVVIDEPVVKCYPEVAWIALKTLLDDENLVEIY